ESDAPRGVAVYYVVGLIVSKPDLHFGAGFAPTPDMYGMITLKYHVVAENIRRLELCVACQWNKQHNESNRQMSGAQQLEKFLQTFTSVARITHLLDNSFAVLQSALM